jgi:N-formylglutamate deformylase
MTEEGSREWLEVHRGDAPLLLCFPHSGTTIPDELGADFASPWLARKDADWWIDRLYAFARDLGATTVRTDMSRSVIDCNRDPSGASLYPGQATTELCPTTTFDNEPLYVGPIPDEAEIARRRARYFKPYHAAIVSEIERLRSAHDQIVLYDAHSIRSHVPRLFEGELPQFNIGTNDGRTCDPALAKVVENICRDSGESHVLNGRFKGGWTTRHYGQPARGVHAIQMELAMRGYHAEPEAPTPETWPGCFDPARAVPITATLSQILKACIAFVSQQKD